MKILIYITLSFWKKHDIIKSYCYLSFLICNLKIIQKYCYFIYHIKIMWLLLLLLNISQIFPFELMPFWGNSILLIFLSRVNN